MFLSHTTLILNYVIFNLMRNGLFLIIQCFQYLMQDLTRLLRFILDFPRHENSTQF